jgi:carboxymethylenebutenolidase
MERKKAGDFDPQLLSLFHRYIHGGINRREFLDGAAKFAVGGLTATALWDMLRPNYALAQQVPKDDKRIRAEHTMYPSPKGNSTNGTMRGLLARPATGDKFPMVLVIHENRGLNPYIEDVVRRLAYGLSAAIHRWKSMEPKPTKRRWRCRNRSIRRK